MKKSIIPLLVLIILTSLGFWAWERYTADRAQELTMSKQTAAPNAAPATYRGTFGWAFVPAGEDESRTPRMSVSVTPAVSGKTYDLGLHQGTCSVLNESQLLPGEVAGATCLFAGSGDELGIFEEGDHLVAKVGKQETRSPDREGFRGDFEPMFTIK